MQYKSIAKAHEKEHIQTSKPIQDYSSPASNPKLLHGIGKMSKVRQIYRGGETMTEETNNIEITKARSRVTTNTPALFNCNPPVFERINPNEEPSKKRLYN
jgi:hypothetical protein